MAQSQITKAQERQRLYYDAKATKTDFNIGDKVFLHNPAVAEGKTKKLAHLWHGHYKVISLNLPNAELASCYPRDTKVLKVHVNRLKQFKKIDGYNNEPAEADPDPDDSTEPLSQEF